jgi:hypothetical protein
MDVKESRELAMADYCDGFLVESITSRDATDCTRDFVSEYPLSGEAWRLRSWVLEKSGAADADVEAAYDKFIRYADPKDELHQREVAELKQWRRMKKQKQASGQR